MSLTRPILARARPLFFGSFLFFSLSLSAAELSYDHKLFGRSSSGIISNVGRVTGSGFSFGGASSGVAFFLNDALSAGVAYKVESNLTSVPLKGFDLFTRYYPLGYATRTSVGGAGSQAFVMQRTWNPYAGLEYSNRDFYIELDPEAATSDERAISGTLSAINGLIGVDYRLSRHWELTAEANVTVLPFVGSDPRVKVRWVLVSFGMNYLF